MSVLQRLAAAGALCVVLLSGCATMSATNAYDLNGTAWVLSSLGGRAPLADRTVSAQFDGGRAQGTDGCNRYSALYTRTGSELNVGQRGPSTLMACAPEVMKQAEGFIAALTGAKRYRVEGSRLDLLGADGAVLASFTAQSQALAGTSWRVTGFNNGRQAVVSPINGTELTLAFREDGRYGGSGGCNTFNGTYTAQGLKVTLGPAAATRKMCPQPPGVMEQEQQFLKALQTAAVARFEGDRLELRTGEGAIAATLLKAAAPR